MDNVDIRPAPSFQQPASFPPKPTPPKLTRLQRLEAIHAAAVAEEKGKRSALPFPKGDLRYHEPASAITALLIEACALAYHPSTCIHEALSKNEFEQIALFFTTDVQSPEVLAGKVAYPKPQHLRAFGFSDGVHAYVVFRGSQYLNDWGINARSWMIGRPGRHAGFDGAWNAVSGKIFEWLQQPAMAHRPVFVAGHSLGGAVGVIAALAIAKAGRAIGGIVTVGQPRVGGPGFSKAFLKEPELGGLGHLAFSYRHGRDPVPKVPPPWLGFSHFLDPTPIKFEPLFPAVRAWSTAPGVTENDVAVSVARFVFLMLSSIPGSTGLMAHLFPHVDQATLSAIEAAGEHKSIGYVRLLSPGRLLGDKPRTGLPPKPGALRAVGAAALVLGIVWLGHLLGGGRLLLYLSLVVAAPLVLLAAWNFLRGRAVA